MHNLLQIGKLASNALFFSLLTWQLPAHAAEPWMDSSLTARERANHLLSAMTQDEKITLVHGAGWGGTYVGMIPAIPRLGIPAINLQDGPAGVAAGMTQVTAFPAPAMVAASWDTVLMKQYNAAMAAEEKGKGANVHLAPMMNINRIPQSGRNFEGFGEDPFLTSRMAEASVAGIQSQGIIATAKHFINNEQETERERVSADIDARTVHEIYLPPFKASVQAGVGSVMCGYNKINGVWACENGTSQNNWLKGELGFDGWIMSDWNATHSTVDSASSGMDMQMPDATYFGSALANAIASNQVPQSRLDDMVRRIVTPMFQIGLFDRAPVGSPNANVQSEERKKIARDASAQGTILLKNQNDILPIDASNVRSIAVIGSAADSAPIVVGGGSGMVIPPYIVSPLKGIQARAGKDIQVRYAYGDSGNGVPITSEFLKAPSGESGLQADYYSNTSLSGDAVISRVDPHVDFQFFGASPGSGLANNNWSARWRGTLTPPVNGPYTLYLASDDGSRLYVNGNLVIDNWGDHALQTKSTSLTLNAGQAYNIEVQYYQGAGAADVHFSWALPNQTKFSDAVAAASTSDLAVVVVGLTSSEGSDRPDLSLPPGQDDLISAVVQANPRTIVVAYTPAQILMPWADQVPAILLGNMPGQEAGNALASLLFGDVNPSAKLPMTLARNVSDYPANTPEQYPGVNLHSVYSEGLNVGYRHFDARNIEPLFPFGHGLSYTSFEYSDFSMTSYNVKAGQNIFLAVNVKNSGNRAGAEVVQFYLGYPSESSEPPKQLKFFRKIWLEAGEMRNVLFSLSPEQYSFWSAGSGSWIVQPGDYQASVGSSSRDIRQSKSFKISGGSLDGKIFQAEEASLGGGAATAQDHAGYTGQSFAASLTNVGASVSFDVNVPASAAYRVSLRYANSNGPDRTLSVYVNGQKIRKTVLPILANWDMWDYKTENLYLNAGRNTITYRYDDGDSANVNIDSIIVNEKPNLALNKPVTVSSVESDQTPARNAVDGDPSTRWSSSFGEPQWIQVDLGAVYALDSVVLRWETAHARGYKIETSLDGEKWKAVYETSTGDGNVDEVNGSAWFGSARYVRVNAQKRGTEFGISLWDLEVYGSSYRKRDR